MELDTKVISADEEEGDEDDLNRTMMTMIRSSDDAIEEDEVNSARSTVNTKPSIKRFCSRIKKCA